uniref:Uncharacterized protein n=1 Tax=Oryza brachyantha TaxID=4533 RepID=J3KU69_ORYBR
MKWLYTSLPLSQVGISPPITSAISRLGLAITLASLSLSHKHASHIAPCWHNRAPHVAPHFCFQFKIMKQVVDIVLIAFLVVELVLAGLCEQGYRSNLEQILEAACCDLNKISACLEPCATTGYKQVLIFLATIFW